MSRQPSITSPAFYEASGPINTTSSRRRAVAAGIIGNTLEWFDFGVYGFLATILAKQFFPASDQYTALLQTFAAFGAGFIARPLGSILLGRLSDIVGRKKVMLITLVIMAIGTLILGVVPNYAQIGIAAPILMLIARILQGFAAGGEWGTAATFLAEWSKTGRRGFYGGLLLSSVSGGLLLGSATASLLSNALSPADMQSWGWRIPFLLGAAMIPLAIYIRRYVEEPPVFASNTAKPQRLPKARFVALLIRAIGICLPLLIASYLVTVYMPSYGQIHAHIPPSQALWSNTLALALTVVCAPMVGALSDRYGRRRPMIISGVLLVLLSLPLFMCITVTNSVSAYVSVQVLLTLLTVGFNGAVPATVTELFPTSMRSTGASLANGIAGVMGGFTPFAATWLIQNTGSIAAPGWLLVLAAGAGLAAVLAIKETAFSELATNMP